MTEVPSITPTDAAARHGNEILLDVREIDEWVAGHAPGARHIPLTLLQRDTFAPGTTVLCVCRSGGRSLRAAEALRDAGVDAINVVGGMSAWEAAALPVVCDDGSPGVIT